VFSYFFRNKVGDVDDLFGFCGRESKLHRAIIAGSSHWSNRPLCLIQPVKTRREAGLCPYFSPRFLVEMGES
jgi:hypothetical protein